MADVKRINIASGVQTMHAKEKRIKILFWAANEDNRPLTFRGGSSSK